MKTKRKVMLQATHTKPHVLITIDTLEVGEAHKWFEEIARRYSFEKVFVADMKAPAPLETPIGIVALIKFDLPDEMEPTLFNIGKELQRHDGWKCSFMKADWIEINQEAATPVRKVSPNGCIHFKNDSYYVGKHLRGETVDIKVDNGTLRIYHQGTLVKTHRLKSKDPLGWKSKIMSADWEEPSFRKVDAVGRITFKGKKLQLPSRLAGEFVRVEINKGSVEIYHDGNLIKTYQMFKVNE